MTETKPDAPWRVGYSDGSGEDCIISGDEPVAVVRWGCGCCKPTDPLTAKEISRARLIAAAPDLLSALRAIALSTDEPGIRLMAQEAIAKATKAEGPPTSSREGEA